VPIVSRTGNFVPYVLKHVPINPSYLVLCVLPGDEIGTNCTGKNNLKPDAEKLGACAFVPCPMATCALKCVVVSAINQFEVVE